MLCQFTFKNYKSYKNETVLDFQAVSNQNFQDSTLRSSNDGNAFLPTTVIYGPNGGGKSNVLDALYCIISLVMMTINLFNNQKLYNNTIELTPFLFDKTSKKEPIEFELFFRPNDNYEYRYSISILSEKITKESLCRRKLGKGSRITQIFKRDAHGIELGASIDKKSINKNVNDHIPYLSFLYINYKIDPIITAISWFKECIICNYSNPDTERLLFIKEDIEFKNKLIKLMNEVGINISNFNFIKNSNDESSYELIFEHNVNDNLYNLNIRQEAAGVQKLFQILPFIILSLTNGALLIIDDLDAKLHTKLLKCIIMLFKNPEINKKNAQLLFTSHDISSMKSSVFRTDEIWFACKNEDESSDLYSLYELRDESGNRIHPSAAYGKQYLEGRYGAEPCFQKLLDWK